MFFNNFIKILVFLSVLSSLFTISAMDSRRLQSTVTSQAVQSVFGHRLRLKNNTQDQLLVEIEMQGVKKTLLSVYNESIDLGSIHDQFNKITISSYGYDKIADFTIEIPIEQLKLFKNIAKDHLLYLDVYNNRDVTSFSFNPAPYELNRLVPNLNVSSFGIGQHIVTQAFPAFKSLIGELLRKQVGIDDYANAYPDKFYQCILNLPDGFTKHDLVTSANRLYLEWNPYFYKQYGVVVVELISDVQEYILQANDFLSKSFDEPVDLAVQEIKAPAPLRYSCLQTFEVLRYEDQASSSSSSSDFLQRALQALVLVDKPIQHINSNLNKLLTKVKEGITPYQESRVSDLRNNAMLLDVFKLKSPIITYEELSVLLDECIKKFKENISINFDNSSYLQKQLITPGSNVNIVGDIHGSIHSVIKILENQLSNMTENTKFVFLGDYTDRGLFGVEVLVLLMTLKMAYWNSVFLVRGNHESYGMNSSGGNVLENFKSELEAKYGSINGNALLLKISELYKHLPLVVFLGTTPTDWAQFCHGGFQPDFNPKDFLSSTQDIWPINFSGGGYSNEINGFLWGDFYLDGSEILQNSTSRGLSFIREINNVLATGFSIGASECSNIKALFRGHQHWGSPLKMFHADDMLMPDESVTDFGFTPVPWEMVVDQATFDSRRIRISNYVPIFTFSTATEYGVAEQASYGIWHTAQDFNDWILQPVLEDNL